MIELKPIGIIRTPFTEPQGMPIQPAGADGVKGTIEVFADYRAGLKDLEGFSHIVVLYHFHRSNGYKLQVVPFLDTQPRGLFSTRAPRRPNPIGLSVVQLDAVVDGILHVSTIDILDETPLIDIKPYVPAFDAPEATRIGWLDTLEKNVSQKRSDRRFLRD
ncbi:MAG: tRNA (N6-threonylcarbamoyladenosine(37)-N6)-methyltransferase TrmO [Chitinivibrionales bacterium]|nr:tRNA (N6-threonylcarbamoyladenosine(37)-N6)-methyltransferase TrmO [Chitinivibrionales bacterium]MBD3356867.1 tRNA (N6-threonylcarbamoyladenosine(37)-N6)-methyltransferase TrmO [Chitinivibrionales bacterium]